MEDNWKRKKRKGKKKRKRKRIIKLVNYNYKYCSSAGSFGPSIIILILSPF